MAKEEIKIPEGRYYRVQKLLRKNLGNPYAFARGGLNDSEFYRAGNSPVELRSEGHGLVYPRDFDEKIIIHENIPQDLRSKLMNLVKH